MLYVVVESPKRSLKSVSRSVSANVSVDVSVVLSESLHLSFLNWPENEPHPFSRQGNDLSQVHILCCGCEFMFYCVACPTH